MFFSPSSEFTFSAQDFPGLPNNTAPQIPEHTSTHLDCLLLPDPVQGAKAFGDRGRGRGRSTHLTPFSKAKGYLRNSISAGVAKEGREEETILNGSGHVIFGLDWDVRNVMSSSLPNSKSITSRFSPHKVHSHTTTTNSTITTNQHHSSF